MGINGVNSNYIYCNRKNNGYNNVFANNSINNSPIFTGSNGVAGDSFNNRISIHDGKDDGSIGFGGAVKNMVKGVGNFFKGMFFDERGKFSIGRTLTTIGMGVAIGAACAFLPTIAIAGTTFSTLGLISAGFLGFAGLHAGSAALDIMDAKTDADAEKAWQSMGSALTEGGLAYLGYRAAGGIHAKNTAPTSPSGSTPKTPKTPKSESATDTSVETPAPKTPEPVVEKPSMTMTAEARIQYNRTKALMENSKHKPVFKTRKEDFDVPNEFVELRKYIEDKYEKASALDKLESVVDPETFAYLKRTTQLFDDAINGKEGAIESIEKELGIKISNIITGEKPILTVEYAKNDSGVIFRDVENVTFDNTTLTLNFSNAKWNKTSVETLTKSIDSLIDTLQDGGQKQLYTARRNKLVTRLNSYLERNSENSFEATKVQGDIYKMECFLRDMNSGLERTVSKLDKPHSQTFKFQNETLNLEFQYTEVIKLPNGINMTKYYNADGELVAVVENSGKFSDINPMDIFNNTKDGAGIKLYNQNGFHQLDFAYYEMKNGEFTLTEGIYQGKPIHKKACAPTDPNYLRIQLGKMPYNRVHQALLEKLSNKEANHPIRQFLEKFYEEHPDMTQLNYIDVCTAFKEFLNKNPKVLGEIQEAAGENGLVINFGKGKNGEMYFGINSTKVEGVDPIITTIGERQNVYQGKCAENTLFAQAGENLRGQFVFDMKFYKNKQDGNFYVGQYPPCSTCYSEVSSHQWKHPGYMLNRSSVRV